MFSRNFAIGNVPVTANILIGWSRCAELADYEQSLSSENGDFQALIGLNGLDDGAYTVGISNDVNAIVTDTRFYISNDLARQRPFSICQSIRIRKDQDEMKLGISEWKIGMYSIQVNGNEIQKFVKQ